MKSSEGLTPVHIAALWGRIQNLKVLIHNGGDIHETDDEGNNALDFACLSGENNADSCIKFLLEAESSSTHALTSADNRPIASLEQSTSDFSESFYTAIGESDESVLDHTVVTFPKLHPWNVEVCATDFDATVVDGLNDLSIASCR